MGQKTSTSFTKGHKPKPGGQPPKGPAVEMFRAFVADVAASPSYRKKLRVRMIGGKLSPGLEQMLLSFALGTPGPLPMPPGPGAPEPAAPAPLDSLAVKLLALEPDQLVAALDALSHMSVATTPEEKAA
jgi:hypothetical protein